MDNLLHKTFQNKRVLVTGHTGFKGSWLAIWLKELGAEVLSISTDSVHVHKAWSDTSKAVSNVKFPMLSDKNGNISRSYNSYIEDEGVSLRGTFIIDPEGILKTIEIHDNSIGRNANELYRILQAAKYVSQNKGQVCPASWAPGKETLRPGLDLVGKI